MGLKISRARNVILFTCLSSLSFGKVSDQLELLVEMQASDSVVSITQSGREKITVQVWDRTKGEPRTLEAPASIKILEKLKASAAIESIPWIVSEFQVDTVIHSESSLEDAEERTSKSSLRQNKLKFVSTQTLFSTYTYGIALPIALEAPEQAGAMGLLALPISFGAHYYFAWNKDYYDSHLLATSYFGINALALSYALPFFALGADANAFRIGNFAVLAAYPLGLHYGYKHGTRFQNEPGRVSLQSSFAYSMGAIGFSALFLWSNLINDGDVALRVVIGQTFGAAIAGHYLSNQYRTHEKVPGGIGPGISTFTILGGLTAASVLTSVEPDSPEIAGLILMGGLGGGFIAGQKYFYDKYDNFERSAYNSLGMVAGAVTPLGLMLLAGANEDSPATFLWTATAGALGGYFVTRHFTESLVEHPHRLTSAKGFFKNIAFNPCPIPVLERVQGKQSVKFVAPFFSATF